MAGGLVSGLPMVKQEGVRPRSILIPSKKLGEQCMLCQRDIT